MCYLLFFFIIIIISNELFNNNTEISKENNNKISRCKSHVTKTYKDLHTGTYNIDTMYIYCSTHIL